MRNILEYPSILNDHVGALHRSLFHGVQFAERLREQLQVARASTETLYGMAQPSWSAKTEDEQKELLRRALAVAETHKLRRVNILNYKGRTIGYATADKVEIYNP